MNNDSETFYQNTLYSTIKLGIVCPMANERKTAQPFVCDVLKECRKFNFKSVSFFAILDNASKDGTIDIMRDYSKQTHELHVVFAPENQCVVDAYIRGYREAINSECDWILEIDAGYSHQPSDISKFFKTMIQGYDGVFGSRFCLNGKMTDCAKSRYITSLGGTIISNLLLGTKLSDMTSGFELFKREALQKILNKGILSKGPFFQTEIRAYAHQFRITEVPIHYKAASHDIRGAEVRDAFSSLWRLFRVRFSKGLIAGQRELF
jgi:dolichol-phosphate mannosyltransferase